MLASADYDTWKFMKKFHLIQMKKIRRQTIAGDYEQNSSDEMLLCHIPHQARDHSAQGHGAMATTRKQRYVESDSEQ